MGMEIHIQMPKVMTSILYFHKEGYADTPPLGSWEIGFHIGTYGMETRIGMGSPHRDGFTT